MEECVSVDEMRNFALKRKMTHEQISEELQRRNSGVRDLSVMSVRHFCSKHNIHQTTQISDGQLDCDVLKAVSQVSLKSKMLVCGYLLCITALQQYDNVTMNGACVGWAHIWTENDAGQACSREYKSARQKNFKVTSKSCSNIFSTEGAEHCKIAEPSTLPCRLFWSQDAP